MPTTAAVLYLRPTLGATTTGTRTTGAVLFFPLRDSTGQFTSGGGVQVNRNLRGLRALKPHRSVPMTDESGMITDQWERYFGFLNGTFLHVNNGPTLPDVAASITYSQASSLINEAVISALSTQANANAQVIQGLREVIVAATLAGAAQIPAPKLYPAYTPPGAAPIIPISVFDLNGGGE